MQARQAALRLAAGAAACLLLSGAGVASAQPEVAAKAATPTFEVGRTYSGKNGYIEYFPGDAPVILTAPHGGDLAPDQIPDRSNATCGGERAVLQKDMNTAELVLAMRESFHERYGVYPHVIINRLARRKLDANRPLTDAACGNAEAALAFREWHAFINVAKAQVIKTSGRGWYMDIHGHGHKIQRLELGYLLGEEQLNASDSTLDSSKAARDRVSIRSLVEQTPSASLSAFLRGPSSLGSLYARGGFPAVPSETDKRPGDDTYFNGGENTRRHTCGDEAAPRGGQTAGPICGVQIEANFKGVRDTPENRKRFGDVTAQVLGEYLRTYWGLSLKPLAPASAAP